LMELSKEFRFEAAHRLPRLPSDHACATLHGHSYRVEVGVNGPVDASMGWVIDFAEIKEVVRPVIAALDHRCLNDIEGLSNPTSESLARWLWARLAPGLPLLSVIAIGATCAPRCTYRGSAPGTRL
jgi:6-pyruvoyltetrahydropterin/6-carboxytetrahydropterin synthase